MKKSIIFFAAVVMLAFFCSCAKNEKDKTGIQNNKLEGQNNSIVGAWYNDAEKIVLIFSREKKLVQYEAKVSYSSDPKINTVTYIYEFSGNNQLTISGNNSGSTIKDTFRYQLSGNTLVLSMEEYDFQIRFTRAKNTTNASKKFVGKWKLLGAEFSGDTYYKRNLYEITFYADGTLKGIMDNEWNEAETVSGTYSVIHDGATLQMAYPVIEQKAVAFPCDGIMILTTDYGGLIYVGQ